MARRANASSLAADPNEVHGGQARGVSIDEAMRRIFRWSTPVLASLASVCLGGRRLVTVRQVVATTSAHGVTYLNWTSSSEWHHMTSSWGTAFLESESW